MALPSRSLNKPVRTEKSLESYESFCRRNAAAEMLQDYEKLGWLSLKRCESIAQTRIYLQHIIAGLDPDDEDARPVKWKEDLTPRPVEPADSARAAVRKGKERVGSAATSHSRAPLGGRHVQADGGGS